MMKQDDIDKRIDKLIAQSEKEIEKLFSNRLKVIKALIEDMFEKYEGSEPHITWTNFNKYNRLNKELRRISEMMNDDYKIVAKTIKQSQQNAYIEKYMMSLFLYELASQSDMQVKVPSAEVIQKAIEQPIEFIKLVPTLQKQRNQVLEKIRMHITQGIMSGEGYSKIAKALRDDIGISMAQSKRVARTEAGRAMSIAGQESAMKAKENGIEMTKMWNATRDTRTRDTHRHLDGQKKKLTETFKSSGCVGLSPKTFIGVSSAKENINCRCKLMYLIDDEVPEVMRVRNDDGSTSIVDFQTYEDWVKTKEKGD
ncbi:phage head morphogenesis protein [Mammaliicoccus sciuri]|uniref:phage head morphogenesis protein n=1 Tax=Mammaliicoccus sciuri TaxID=1296 RepID=UPI001071F0E4|nr:phage head morphogenesis protein [Mammaliicoccus sciuri]MBF0773278.1 phage head morphogenesis protein [Mammaliicoccus sciuri]TFU88295.1 phage head morphogenesis protein [Mammaliicoccus sciuri]